MSSPLTELALSRAVRTHHTHFARDRLGTGGVCGPSFKSGVFSSTVKRTMVKDRSPPGSDAGVFGFLCFRKERNVISVVLNVLTQHPCA